MVDEQRAEVGAEIKIGVDAEVSSKVGKSMKTRSRSKSSSRHRSRSRRMKLEQK